MDQQVAAVAGLDDVFAGDGIAGDDDALAVFGDEEEAIGFAPVAVLDGDGSDAEVGVFIDFAGFEFDGFDAVGFRVAVFEALDAIVGIGFVGLLDVVGHALGSFGTVELEGAVAVKDGGGKVEIAKAGGVVRVEVGKEGDLEVGGGEGGEFGGRGAADYAGAEIDNV